MGLLATFTNACRRKPGYCALFGIASSGAALGSLAALSPPISYIFWGVGLGATVFAAYAGVTSDKADQTANPPSP